MKSAEEEPADIMDLVSQETEINSKVQAFHVMNLKRHMC
jgi:hypothetical protein